MPQGDGDSWERGVMATWPTCHFHQCSTSLTEKGKLHKILGNKGGIYLLSNDGCMKASILGQLFTPSFSLSQNPLCFAFPFSSFFLTHSATPLISFCTPWPFSTSRKIQCFVQAFALLQISPIVAYLSH